MGGQPEHYNLIALLRCRPLPTATPNRIRQGDFREHVVSDDFEGGFDLARPVE